MKTFASVAALSLLSSYLAFAETACRVEGEASVNAFTIDTGGFSSILPGGPAPIYDSTEQFFKMGNELGSSTAIVEGTDMVFRGRPVVGGLAYGIYPSWDGSQIDIWTQIEFSTNWKPDGQEVCTKHKTVFSKGRKCVRREIQYFPTSFVVDLTTEAGVRRHYIKQFTNINQANHYTINMPRLVCMGPVTNFEVRVLDLNGGEVEFKVHKISYKAGIKL